MSGLNFENDAKLRTCVRKVSRWGTLCGLFAMLTLMTGCPEVIVPCPNGVSDCGDGLVCSDEGVCGACATDADCGGGTNAQASDPRGLCAELDSGNVCVECLTDAGCDDGDACNGTETCDGIFCVAGTELDSCEDGDPCTDDSCDPVSGECVFVDMVCAPGEVCDLGDCVAIPCDVAADCEDNDLCTTVACDAGACLITPVNCDNGDFCDGEETCDPTDGICVSPGDPCAAGGQSCDEANDACTDVTTCTIDADCDDGLFCNGTETCGTDSNCASGAAPCAADEDCDEVGDVCNFTGSSKAFTLTANSDTGADFAGTSGNDTYDAQLFLTGGGGFVLTLNNADNLDGGSGTDTLSAQFNPAAATTTTPTMKNIEVFNLEVTTAFPQTLSMANGGAETTFNFNNSSTDAGDLLITNVANMPTNFGMTNSTEDFNVSIAEAALSGTADACTLTLDGVTLTGGEPTIVLEPNAAAKSGYETINIVSNGGIVNSIQDLQQGNGNSLTTINVTGGADLDMNANAVDTTVTTFDASGATGDVDVLVPGDNVAGTAITVNGGSGDDDLDCTDSADENFTVNGGAGDDRITFNGNYDSASPFTDTVEGGDGEDTMVVLSVDAVTTEIQSAVTGIEILEVSNVLGGDLDAGQFWGAITKVTLANGIDTTARIITLPDGGTLDMDADAGDQSHSIVVAGTGTLDAITLDLAAGVDFLGTTGNPDFTTGVETLTIKGASTAGTKNIFADGLTMTASAGGSTRIVITGANEIEFVGVVTAGIIDGSAATGVIDIQANMPAAASISGGSAADNLRGSDSNDVINGNAGADTIDGQDGEDTLNGGAGADTFKFALGDQSVTPSSSIFKTITDFESDTDIIDNLSNLSIVSGTTNFGTATASINSEGVCTFAAADDTLQERIIACEDGIVENGTPANGQFAIFEHGGHTYMFISDGVDALGADDVLIQFNGVTGLTDTTIDGSNNVTIK